jgi:tripartite-type tricarboxylate transporter receptor subunit TctC
MPLALRQRIAADVIEVLKDPVVVKRLQETGQAVVAEGPNELLAIVKRQQVAMSRLATILDMPKKE